MKKLFVLFAFLLCVLCLLVPQAGGQPVHSQSNPLYCDFSSANNSHWMLSSNFDTVTGYWSHIPSLNRPLAGVNSIYLPDSNKIFLSGGMDSLRVPQNSCFFFDPENNLYTQKASLPRGRAFGKIVRVRDSLYLVGSVGPSWDSADGLIYMYNPHSNQWTLKDTMPLPFVHEPAVCVWRDSLIISIGGSRSAWNSPTNIVRVYNPWTDRWRTIPNSFLAVVTSSQAECLGDSIAVVGGLGSDYINAVYKGRIISAPGNDTLSVRWVHYAASTPFGFGVYRIGGGKWGDIMLFGPAMRLENSYGQIFGLRVQDTSWVWVSFTPSSLDSAGNRPTISVIQSSDTARFFLFGGFKLPNILASSEKYSFFPPPIGITGEQNNIPENFVLFQNYPNPFNGTTKIQFIIPPLKGDRGMNVRLFISDLLGRQVALLIDQKLIPGTYEIQWSPENLASGIYFYTLNVSGTRITRKMVFLK